MYYVVQPRTILCLVLVSNLYCVLEKNILKYLCTNCNWMSKTCGIEEMQLYTCKVVAKYVEIKWIKTSCPGTSVVTYNKWMDGHIRQKY